MKLELKELELLEVFDNDEFSIPCEWRKSRIDDDEQDIMANVLLERWDDRYWRHAIR